MSDRARALVEGHERTVDAAVRRARGVHYTPAVLAAQLVRFAFDELDRTPRSVCDPTCGSGSFLLAAADDLRRRGVPADEVVRSRLFGAEIDAEAAAVCRAVLSAWAGDHGVSVPVDEIGIVVADTSEWGPADWHALPEGGFDAVVGNPPFLSQLSSRSSRSSTARADARRRLGVPAGYADAAALFLDSAVDLVGSDGVVCLVQPQSFLAARDTAPVRRAVRDRAQLVALWGSEERIFDADVQVCAPVLRVSTSQATADDRGVEVHWGVPGVRHDPVRLALDAPTWGPLLAGPLGVPPVAPLGGRRLGDVATATAGFRDEFYALTDAMFELDEAAPSVDGAVPPGAPRLVTVGMIDVAHLGWGRTPRRVRGAPRLTPRLDLERLADSSPRVHSWATARLVPKVLVATQTRVVEAVADPVGDCVPVTPTISVEPRHAVSTGAGGGDVSDVWHLAAALVAPPVAATALRDHLGAGLSVGALRWSARSVLDVALPIDDECWERGAALVRELQQDDGTRRSDLLDQLGPVMTEAYGLDPEDPVTGWWRALVV